MKTTRLSWDPPVDVDTRRDCSLMMSACGTYTSRKCVECIVPCSRRCCGHPLLLERFFDALGHLVGFWMHPLHNVCLEDSVISIISPSSGGSPGPV